jgi:isoleucyl-tRNA synthetase
MFSKPVKKPKLTKIDNLFVDYLEDLTKFCEENYEKYNFYHPAINLRNFLKSINKDGGQHRRVLVKYYTYLT